MEESNKKPGGKHRIQGAGPGRPKGSQNKVPTELRQMILTALDKAGGIEYLARQADKNPKAFLSLLGRVLPMQVTGESGGPISITFTQTDSKL